MKKFFIILLAFNLIALDFFAGYYFYNNYLNPQNKTEESQNDFPLITFEDGCDSDCQREIYNQINLLKNSKEVQESVSITPTTEPTKSPSAVSVVKTKTKAVSYVPIPGTGSVLSTDWSDISGTDFYLSKSDFEGLVGVYFEANFRLQNGNGTASLRVYDKTHSIAPSGGEISTTSQSSTFVSGGPIYLWEGNNHYVVQAKSSTSDTTIFESGRLKIITEN